MKTSIKMQDHIVEALMWFLSWFVSGTFWFASTQGFQTNPYNEIYLLLTASSDAGISEIVLAFIQALSPIAVAFISGHFMLKIHKKDKKDKKKKNV